MDRERKTELMSAYLDGELTPAERAEAERLLEASPELRDELNDFARLSDLLRALPRESAPMEMAAAIRREAERKSLLGPELAAPQRSWMREIVVAVSAMAATVLGMLLLPKDAWQHSPQFADRTAPMSSPAESDRLIASSSEVPWDAASAGADQAEELASAKVEPEVSMLAMRAAAPAAPPPALDHDAEIAAGLANGFSLNGIQQGQDAVRIGDVVPYFQNGVGVVVLTVVDVESAGDRVAVLLANNGLSVPPELVARQLKERTNRDEKLAAAQTRKLNDDQQLMVYLHAPRETITQVLDEMVQEQLFSQVQLEPPVDAPEFASIDGVTAEAQIAAADKFSTEESVAEQLLANNAAAVGQNYRSRQHLTVDQNRDGMHRKASGQKDQVADRNKSEPQTQSFSKMARSRTQANTLADDSPVDAMLPQNSLGLEVFKQNYAAVMKLDAVSGEVLDNTLMLAQGQQAEAKRVLVAEKAKGTAEGLEKAGNFAEAEGPSDEPNAERTIRVLLVLQTRAAAKSP